MQIKKSAHCLLRAWAVLVAAIPGTPTIVAAAADAPVFGFTEKPGGYTVGLKVVEQYDYSRTYRPAVDALGKPYRGERARPLQTLVWYPAKANRAKPMTVGDYLDLWATETTFGRPEMPSRAKEWRAGMQRALAMPLWALRDAPVAAGRFPVVIYAPGASQPAWDNADLCEYLASHGYVVIASPSFGAARRDMTIDMPGIHTQVDDIAFLIGYAHGLSNANPERLAIIGYSWGGISNVFAAARDGRIDALVALDGSLRFSPGLVTAGGIDPHHMTIPLLSIAQGLWTPEDKADSLEHNPDHDGPDVLNAWTHGDLVSVNILPLSHMEHGSMHQRNDDIWWNLLNVYGQKKAGFTRADGMIGYAWLARYTLSFLNAYLKQDAAALVFLKKTSADNGAPAHYLDVRFRASDGKLASFDTLREEIGPQGFSRAGEILAAFRKEHPTFKPDESLMLAWAEELIDGGHSSEAMAVLQLNVQLFPDSSDAFARLGWLYRQLGQKAPAIENLRRAEALSATNADARRALVELEASAPTPDEGAVKRTESALRKLPVVK